MVTEVVVRTDAVAMGNGAEVDPAATVTLAGTVIPDLLLESVTTSPPAGATPVSVTVPVDALPPLTDAGLSVTLLAAGAVTVSAAVFVTPR